MYYVKNHQLARQAVEAMGYPGFKAYRYVSYDQVARLARFVPKGQRIDFLHTGLLEEFSAAFRKRKRFPFDDIAEILRLMVSNYLLWTTTCYGLTAVTHISDFAMGSSALFCHTANTAHSAHSA
jgi:hypothetical protein